MISIYFALTNAGNVAPQTTAIDPPANFNLLFTVLLPTLLLIAGARWGNRRSKLLSDWYLGQSLEHPDQPPPPHVRTLALNQPVETSLISMAMWVLAGVIVAMVNFNARRDAWDAVTTFLSVGGLAGSIVGIISYFLTERLWQPELALFFPAGDLSATRAFRITVRRRVLLLFTMSAIPLLLLAFTAYKHATVMIQADDPATFLPGLLAIGVFFVGVGLLMAVTLGLTLGASLIEPVETLRVHMAAVREGNLERQAPVLSNDELGELAEGFNAMVKGLRQEETVRRLFSLYVTPQVAEHAIEYGAALGGRMAEATVLFADIRGFTAMTEQMQADALIALLNRYFDAMSNAIVANGGLVNKFGGDSLLAVFGTPLNPATDHPAQAVRTAQAMCAALEHFNADQTQRGEPALRIGIGVATGPVVAGNVGSEERLEYTVIGDTVNLASRLQAMTRDLDTTVLMSDVTATAVEGLSPVVSIGDIAVR
ncbi:MAG: adenylate/guanylate cyclase domain-containing protein, partial [Anaerolineae bacterium]|nr:adenylate/guanylate cyclase domain-containing protein [Anaerolineae bacterium]